MSACSTVPSFPTIFFSVRGRSFSSRWVIRCEYTTVWASVNRAESRPHRYNPPDFSSYPSDILSRTSSDFIVVNDLFFTSSPTIGFFLKRILPHPSRAKDKKRLKIHREKYNRSVIIMFTFTSAIFLNKTSRSQRVTSGVFYTTDVQNT